MSLCCENPYDLGCHSACAPIITNIVQPQQGYYIISYTFNGALITREWLATPVGGFLEIPSYIFNESANVTFQIYDGNSVFINCFKAKILPSNSTLQPQPPQPPLTPFTTLIETISAERCLNGKHLIRFTINYNDLQGMLVNTYFTLGAVLTHGGNNHPFTLYYDAGLTQPLYQNEYYNVQNMLPTLNLYMLTELKNCNQHFTFNIVVNSVGFIAPGYVNTVNIGATYIYTN